MLIAALKLLKGLLLILVGIGALRLVHRDIRAIITEWIEVLHLNPERRFIHVLTLRLPAVTDNKLELFGLAMFLYAALFMTEGIGLALCRRWAEYMTIITTGLLLPLEIYELCRKPTPVRMILLLLNIAVVLYLIYRVRRCAAPIHRCRYKGKEITMDFTTVVKTRRGVRA